MKSGDKSITTVEFFNLSRIYNVKQKEIYWAVIHFEHQQTRSENHITEGHWVKQVGRYNEIPFLCVSSCEFILEL